MRFAVFKEENHEIKAIYDCPDESFAKLQCEEGEAYLELDQSVWNEGLIYIDEVNGTPRVEYKNEMSLEFNKLNANADGEDKIIFNNIPSGSRIIVQEGREPAVFDCICDDGTILLTFESEGTYRLDISHPKYLIFTTQLEIKTWS